MNTSNIPSTNAESYIQGYNTRKSIDYNFSQLHFFTNSEKAQLPTGPYAGVEYHGLYSLVDEDGAEFDYPVVSFNYCKTTADGEFETDERLIILLGDGYGVHENHTGQTPSRYLIGPQIGTLQDGKLAELQMQEAKLAPKNYSLACVAGNPYGATVLAN